jgi:hypothetical protein
MDVRIQVLRSLVKISEALIKNSDENADYLLTSNF